MSEMQWQDDSTWSVPSGEFCVYGTVFTDPAHSDDVEAIYKQTTQHAEIEEGTIYYCICRDSKDRSIFHFFERYKNKEAFDKHNEQEIVVKLVNSGWMKDVKAVFAKAIEP